ncbi:MAG TPA: zinc ribbon domain-containing protein [Blastocatellia bacterium]|nr:zinc ribbon domain-containing protein [Blastocatellia bacterium]
MFCPKCGAEELNRAQFCRTCGAELHIVRAALEHPDVITASAVSAREEIGRAVAGKIAEFESAHDLRRAVEDILPAIEKFLQSPEERRLRKEEERLDLIRAGFITMAVGLGLIPFFLVLSWIIQTKEVLIGGGAGGLVFFIGLGLLISGLLSPERFARSNKITKDLTSGEPPTAAAQKKITPAQHPGQPSVTEGTTRQLQE